MKSLLSVRSLRFLLAGGLNTLFSLAVYITLAVTALPTWAILIIATSLGIAFNFTTTGGFVFRDLGIGRLPRFVLTYLGVLFTYWTLIDRLSPIVGGRARAMLMVVGPVAVITYVVQKQFVFAQKSDRVSECKAIAGPPWNPDAQSGISAPNGGHRA